MTTPVWGLDKEKMMDEQWRERLHVLCQKYISTWEMASEWLPLAKVAEEIHECLMPGFSNEPDPHQLQAELEHERSMVAALSGDLEKAEAREARWQAAVKRFEDQYEHNRSGLNHPMARERLDRILEAMRTGTLEALEKALGITTP